MKQTKHIYKNKEYYHVGRGKWVISINSYYEASFTCEQDVKNFIDAGCSVDNFFYK